MVAIVGGVGLVVVWGGSRWGGSWYEGGRMSKVVVGLEG